MTEPTSQLKINPSKLQAVVLTLVFAAMGIVGGATTMLSLLKARDLAGIYNWLQSAPAAGFFAGIVTVASLGMLGARSLVRILKEVYLTVHAPDNVAVLTKPTADPAVPPTGVVQLITGARDAPASENTDAK